MKKRKKKNILKEIIKLIALGAITTILVYMFLICMEKEQEQHNNYINEYRQENIK